MYFKQKLTSIQKQQEENSDELKEYKYVEEKLETLHLREKRLFEWLHDVWKEDEKLKGSLENDQIELQHEQKKIARKIQDKKQTLENEKMDLLHAEENLATWTHL